MSFLYWQTLITIFVKYVIIIKDTKSLLNKYQNSSQNRSFLYFITEFPETTGIAIFFHSLIQNQPTIVKAHLVKVRKNIIPFCRLLKPQERMHTIRLTTPVAMSALRKLYTKNIRNGLRRKMMTGQKKLKTPHPYHLEKIFRHYGNSYIHLLLIINGATTIMHSLYIL